MSEEKKGIEFGVDYIGETPIQKHMREEAEFRKLPLLIQDAGDGKWKAFLEAEVPAIVADTEEEFNQKLLEAGLTPERIQELRQEWEANTLRQGFSWTLKMEVNPKTGEVKAKSSFSDNINIERGVNSIHREIEKDVLQTPSDIVDVLKETQPPISEGLVPAELQPPLLPPVQPGEEAPKGELLEIPGVKIIYSTPKEMIDNWTEGAKGPFEHAVVGVLSTPSSPKDIVKQMFDGVEITKDSMVELPVTYHGPKEIGTPPWEELPNEAVSDVMSDEGLKWVDGKGDKPVYFPAVHKEKLMNQQTAAIQAENVGDGWGAELPPAEQTPTEQPGIPEDKLREVTVPFPADKIREYFGDKSLFFIANYSESKLKGGAFLTYLSNINIPSDVKFNTPISYEEYAEVMKAYMEQPGVVSAAGLHVMAAEMLLVAKGLPYERSPYALPIDSEVILKFIQEYKYLVENWLHFIDSTQVFALRSIKALNDHYKPEERFPVVEDRSYVGSNIAQLFRIPEFIAVYFAIEGATYKLSYFKDQFEEYMFKNETLAKYFGSHNNFAALYFSHYATGLFKPEDVNHGLFKIGVFDKDSEFYVDVPYEASLQV